MLENIHKLQKASEIILGKFARAEIKLFQTDVDDDWYNFISRVTTALEYMWNQAICYPIQYHVFPIFTFILVLFVSIQVFLYFVLWPSEHFRLLSIFVLWTTVLTQII